MAGVKRTSRHTPPCGYRTHGWEAPWRIEMAAPWGSLLLSCVAQWAVAAPRVPLGAAWPWLAAHLALLLAMLGIGFTTLCCVDAAAPEVCARW